MAKRTKGRKAGLSNALTSDIDVSAILRGSETSIPTIDGRSSSKVAQPVLEFSDPATNASIIRGNCLLVLDKFCAAYPSGCFDMIFADPPYFLSNGGITCHAGRMVKVDKGDWDKTQGIRLNHEFNLAWLSRCQSALNPNGTIWITATQHVVFSIGFALQELGFKILNLISWEKPNPPPNLSCRYFTHSTEMVIWAAKNATSKHHFAYQDMKKANDGKQMKTVWQFPRPSTAEKAFGGHPTQKPVALVRRCIDASCIPNGLILDPFTGSGTTGVACIETARRFVGIEESVDYCKLSASRLRQAISVSPTLSL
jgi:site-specific DNA-methyltransferase (adenine-specific)